MSSDSMWAYVLARPHGFERVDVPRPNETDLRPGQVLLRVLVGGICGSDLPFFKGVGSPLSTRDPSGRVSLPPGAPLHEVVGEVVASTDLDLRAGAVVVGWATSMNALSEYVVVNAGDVHEFRSELEPGAAIMLQPLACVINALDRLPGIAGSSTAVIGQGPIGVLFSHVLKDLGAERVVGVDRVDRSDVAATFGVDEAVRSSSDSWASGLASEADRPTIVVEAVGHQVSTMVDAVTALRVGGQMFYFGIPDDPIYPFPMALFLRKHGTLHTGFTDPADRRPALVRADAYLARHPGLVDAYISSRFAFSDVEEAFRVATIPEPGRLKVTLEL